MGDDLFGASADGGPGPAGAAGTVGTGAGADDAAGLPLAVRLRPRTLDEVVGQEHLTRPGGPLQLLVGGSATPSVVLWGPPGTGKTTLAHVVAAATGSRFRELSAVSAGVKDVRAEVAEAQRHLRADGTRTLLFIDEVHRFSKAQQDSLLGPVENRLVTLLAATTENPSFSVVAPLLSRSLLLTLRPLDESALERVLDRALADPRGLGGVLTLSDDARAHLLGTAGGDARSVLTRLEAAAEAALAAGAGEVDLPTLEQAVDRAAVRHSRDAHFDVTSAFVKSMRGGDADATLHYLARLIEAGEDPRYIARRIVVHASEDVGLADPTALRSAVAAADALDRLGLPEARIPLAQAALHVALAPKSNAVVRGIDAALADVRAGRGGPVPAHLRDAHYSGARRQGAGAGYRYPHDDPRGVVRQQHLPDDLVDARYFRPGGAGVEARFAERHADLQAVLRGAGSGPPGTVGPVPVPGDTAGTPAAQVARERARSAAKEA